MRILKNNEIDRDKWLELLQESEFSSPFQTPEFYNFFNSTDGYSADVFVVENKNVYLSIVLVTVQSEKGIKSFFSKRGIVYGGPLIINGRNDILSSLLEYINNYYKKKLIYLEFRNYFEYSIYNKEFSLNKFEYKNWLNIKVRCNDLAMMKNNMSNSRLRQIKKAIQNGARWEEARSKDDIVSFYNILSNLYKTKVKKPLFSIDFFLNFYNYKIGKFLLIYFEDKVIGGIMCPIYNKSEIYEFYVCGLDTEFKDQYPSVMATWAAMEYAINNNIQTFDFMGAGEPNKDYGVRDFKSRFGGELIKNGRYIKIYKPFLYKIGLFGIRLMSKLNV